MHTTFKRNAIVMAFTRYIKLRVAHAPGMTGTFSPPPTSKETPSLLSRYASRHVRHTRAVMHVGIVNPRKQGKRSRHSRRIRNPQIYAYCWQKAHAEWLLRKRPVLTFVEDFQYAPAWISDHMSSKVCGEITYSCTAELWECMIHCVPLYNRYNYLAMRGLKLVHVRKRGPWRNVKQLTTWESVNAGSSTPRSILFQERQRSFIKWSWTSRLRLSRRSASMWRRCRHARVWPSLCGTWVDRARFDNCGDIITQIRKVMWICIMMQWDWGSGVGILKTHM